METQVFIKLSVMIDKMGVDLGAIQGKTNEETGLKIVSLLIQNIHKAEQELYELISLKKGISVEEAKKENVIIFIKDLMKLDGMSDFLV